MKFGPGFFVVALLVIVTSERGRAADGQTAYDQNCGVCHNAIAPKLGDKGAWAARIKQGTDTLVHNVIKGKGAMPPRAGKPDLSDADIKAAVEYMESKAQ
jgi:cytochrome c5